MSNKNILQVVMALVLMGPLSAVTSTTDSLSSTISTFESRTGLDSSAAWDSIAKANLEHFLSKTCKKIRKLEARREKYAKKLGTSKDAQKEEYLLCKINSVEESLKSYLGLHQSLLELQEAMSRKTKK
jgi:hypothetical protein